MAVWGAILLTTRASVADHYRVPSGSMEPTVEVGDRIAVAKAAYGLRIPFTRLWLADPEPNRGDVVVLESPEDGRTLLKRVVALPGDRVAVRGGLVEIGRMVDVVEVGSAEALETIDGRAHRVSLAQGAGPDWGPMEVPEGKLLVLGDNRGASHDGRSFGLVDADRLLGRAVAVYARDGKPTWIDL